jgi:hypothetical protein
MLETDTLTVSAEIAVAFAGFTGVAGGIRALRTSFAKFRLQLRALVEFSLFVMMAALLPLFLWHVELGTVTTWRVASAILALMIALYYVVRYRSLAADMIEAHGEYGWSLRIGVGLDMSFSILLVANAAGVLPWASHVAYLAYVFYGLLATAYSFIVFVSPLWSTPEAAEAESERPAP